MDNLLEWLGIRPFKEWDFSKAKLFGSLLGFVVISLIFILFALSLFSAVLSLSSLIRAGSTETNTGSNAGIAALMVAVISSPIVVWRTFIAHQQMKLQKEGLMTDRFAKAVEQIAAERTIKRPQRKGNGGLRYERTQSGFKKLLTDELTEPHLEIRLGGIQSLERIAQDSISYDNGRDYRTSISILTSYVKQNSPAKNLDPTEPPFQRATLRADIQAVIDVLRRRNDEQIAFEAHHKIEIDLSLCDLSGLDMSRIRLPGARLYRSRLEATFLDKADLRGAEFYFSLLNFSQFREADLRGAKFDHAIYNMPQRGGGISFDWALAKLDGASFSGADITALDHFGLKTLTFGTKDTKLSGALEYHRMRALDIKQRRNFEEDDIPFDEDSLNSFRFWQYYGSNDFVTNHNRNRLYEHLQLSGWPYQK